MALPRRRMWLLAVALVANSLLLGGTQAGEAYACSCAGEGSTEEAFRRSTAVFSAEVVESGELPMGQKGPMDPGMLLLGPVTLDVNAACKGVGGSSVVVHGQGPGASCGLDLERGETYLVFAGGTGRGGDGPLETGLCSATRQAGEETARNMSGPPTGTLPETGGVPLEGTARGTGPKLAAAAALIVSLAAGAIFAGRVACGLAASPTGPASPTALPV